MSQTQVDFKAGEYIDPAYIAYVQEEVTKATLQEAKAWEITEIGRQNICSGDEPDQIGKGEGSVGDNDRHYVPGLPIERPMTPWAFDSHLECPPFQHPWFFSAFQCPLDHRSS